MNINGYQYRRVQCGLPDWVSCTAAFSRAPRARLCAARSHTRTSECGGSFSFRIARNQTAIHLSDMPTTWRHTFYSPRRILHRRKIKGLDQSGLARADWIAKPSDGRAADAILTIKRRAQPGLCLRNNHQPQIPWAGPALPLGKPLPPLNFTSLATKTEQRRSHP